MMLLFVKNDDLCYRIESVMDSLFKNSINQSQGIEQKKFLEKKQILRSFFFQGPLTNADLSKILRLSTPKVNTLLMELLDDGLVRELGRGESSGGRRPVIYGLVEDGFYVAGITINTNRTIISVFNSNNQEIDGPHYFPIRIQPDVHIFNLVSEKLDQILQKLKIEKRKLLAVGIDLPGLINQELGINKTYFPKIEKLAETLTEVFGVSVFIGHDSKVRALTEQQFGLAKDRKNVLLLQVDWGLGLGIIIDGKVYIGKSGYAGEFGHLPIVDNGVLCHCGKQGCLETIVSATAIARMAKEGILGGKSSLISELVNGDPDKIDIFVVLDAADRGDQFAITLFSEVGYWLGKGIAYLTQIFNPELVIIGGRVAEASQFIIAPIQQAINTFSNREISQDTEIKFSAIGPKAGPIGAAAFAIDRIASV